MPVLYNQERLRSSGIRQPRKRASMSAWPWTLSGWRIAATTTQAAHTLQVLTRPSCLFGLAPLAAGATSRPGVGRCADHTSALQRHPPIPCCAGDRAESEFGHPLRGPRLAVSGRPERDQSLRTREAPDRNTPAARRAGVAARCSRLFLSLRGPSRSPGIASTG